MIKRIVLFTFLIIVFFFCFPCHSEAQDSASRPAITVINLVRGNGLGHASDDLLASLKAQWQVTSEVGVYATWLFQYGALENKDMTEFAKQEMKGQEFGLLFEIDRNYAQKSNVQFRGQGEWYFSDGLLLSSYDQSERRKLIDAAFFKFKEIFGYYPKTVGAWWIGGDSLSYMQEKYGITAALRAADQFNLDTYSIWGTPWDIPYLPSKGNEGIPAASFAESTKVVILQWAIRDPLKGYADPLYSLQDYSARGYTPEYVDYLASIFLQKPFGNFVMGLENGETLETFQQSYKTMLTKAREIQASGKVDIVPAQEYAQRFLAQKKVFAGRTHFLSTDYDSNNQSFWYMSENYRATVQKINGVVSFVDLRNYADKIPEDFDILPNSQPTLRINEQEIIDSMTFPDQGIFIRKTSDQLTTKEKGNDVELYAGNDKVAYFTPTGVQVYPESRGGKSFSFDQEKPGMSPFQILCVLYILYFAVICCIRKNIRTSVNEFLLLLLPLLIAFPFLVQNVTFLFDKKETIPLIILFSLHLFPVLTTVYVSKVLPFFILFVLHYVFIVRPSGKVKKYLYWAYYALMVFLYMHVPYFPLDKTTYGAVFASLAVLAIVLVTIAIVIFRKYKTRNMLVLCSIIPPLILLSLAVTVVYSRSKYALTTYEIHALQIIKNQKKSVLYVEQVDNSILPIYKAVKPIVYTDYRIGQTITGKKWEMVMRPEDNVLKISDYDSKLIVIPRYLGSDISDYEITSLHLTKIFDNAQIAIFEKN